MTQLRYLTGYPDHIVRQVQDLLTKGKLGNTILKKYPTSHSFSNNKALYTYTVKLKNEFIRQSGPLSKVVYDDKLDALHHALGLHSFVPRVQGNKLKSKNEIRIGSVFKKVPIEFLRMIVVHELSHLKEKEHSKAFYKLCTHIEPNYYQLEFDTRLYLTHIEKNGKLY